MHILSDASGLPLHVGVSAANVHDSLGLKPMVTHFHIGHELHSDRCKPERLHADKAYDLPDLWQWLHSQHVDVRIARKGIDSSERLGRRTPASSRRNVSARSQSAQSRQPCGEPPCLFAILRMQS